MPLPDKDFDPSESAIPWKILQVNGVEVFFATENGNRVRFQLQFQILSF